MANNPHSSGAAGASEAMRLAVDTATRHSTAQIAQLLNPGGGATDKGALRKSIEALAQNVLEAAAPITVGEAIREAIDTLSLDSVKALASLEPGNRAVQPRFNETVQALRQELGDTIELGTRSALEQAIGKIADSALRIASAAGSLDPATGALTTRSHEQLRQALHNGFGTALRTVTDGATKAVTEIAARALALGLHAAGTNRSATEPSIQVPLEVGIRA